MHTHHVLYVRPSPKRQTYGAGYWQQITAGPFIGVARTLSYFACKMSAPGLIGQLVAITGNKVVTVNLDPAVRPIGILSAGAAAGATAPLLLGPAVYKTNVYDPAILAGDWLTTSAAGYLTPVAAPTDYAIAQAVDVTTGVLTFRLLT